MITSTVT